MNGIGRCQIAGRGATGRALIGLLALSLFGTVGTVTPAAAGTPTGLAPAARSHLTDLAHLDFLGDSVSVPVTAAHSTFRLAAQRKIGVLWVYANGHPDGTFDRTGGGAFDATKNTYGQGAFDADDIARAAVVYLRQWRATGDTGSRNRAYELLRGLTYLQTLTGPHAGEVVLWMQPDGSLNPSPTPADSPNPSDSGASYWLARTLWAVGEGYAAFRGSDPAFASFLKARMDLAVSALDRDVLTNYGVHRIIHGFRVPAWLIVDGADASSEAMLGLAAFAGAGGTAAARTALAELGRGVAEMSAGSTTRWPYRALLPWALSRSDWHAWGAQMPSGLAAASVVLHSPALLRPAVADAAGFTPYLLTSTGPVNGLLPTPTDRSQIAYGADARVQGLLAVGTAAHRPGISKLAGIAAGWFFGANAAGKAVYDPRTGVTNDGVNSDGSINANSGAESTIHGLFTMQALDAHPDLAALAMASARIILRNGLSVIEAESGTLAGNAAVVKPASEWTGESLWSASYVSAGAGSTVSWKLPPAGEPRLVQPVVELVHGARSRTVFSFGERRLGTVRFGAVGPQGAAAAVGMLVPIDLPGRVPARGGTIVARTGCAETVEDRVGEAENACGAGNIDALQVIPVVAQLVSSSAGTGGSAASGGTALLQNKDRTPAMRIVQVPGSGRVKVSAYDRNGRLIFAAPQGGTRTVVWVAPGGFTIVTRWVAVG